jgi:hemolysin-activating ACP:hemolysin acyltransferase
MVNSLTNEPNLADAARQNVPEMVDKEGVQSSLGKTERDLAARLASASLADAVVLMMRSERDKYHSLSDLEWLVLPPLRLRQAMFAYARPAKHTDEQTIEVPPIPIAMVAWAMVSNEVAMKIDDQKKAGVPVRLAPQEWKSGKELRIIRAIGPQKAVDSLLAKLPG